MPTVIEVAHLTRRFGAFVAVDDLTFTIERGEVVGFLGPNGAGKTTTLRILAGYLPASEGRARVCGFDVLSQSLAVRQRIGYLAESVPLYREHRVHEMLAFQGRLHGLSRRDARRRIPAVLERVGLVGRERSLIGQLSRGLRQRVGIAVALLPEPEVLILDEPTSGLDPLQRLEVRRLVRELAAEHTVLLSSHILPEVEAVCPRVIVIHKGRIAADGTQAELVRRLAPPAAIALEARLADPERARARIAALPGVALLREGATERGWTRFELEGEDDAGAALRAALGELARAEGWAVRELSQHRPTLEETFARIALELAPAPAPERGPLLEPPREPGA